MAPYDDDDEPLIAPALSNKKKSADLGVGVCTNRIAILLLVTLFAGAGIYFQSELTELDSQLQSDVKKMANLQDVIRSHEKVIQRFNNSVTNSDVLTHLHDLELQLKTNQHDLKTELDLVKTNIDFQLKSTLDELGETVRKAENEINTEVQKVKLDVESYARETQDQFSMENSFMVYQLAGTFTLLSCLISMWHMTAHLRKFNQPTVQRKILAILWMCPIYAITSWFSLVFRPAEGYLAIIKDFYEAYIIYQFLSFCIAVLGRGDRNAVVELLTKHASHLSPPFRFDALCNKNPYDSDRALAEAVLLQCQGFAMQFVFLRPLLTTIMFILDKLEYYGPTGNPMDYRSPQFYIIGLQNVSVFVAFTGLLKFYHAVDKDLAWCRPFAKFLCIKGVVFMTFWQGLTITILAQTTDVGGEDTEKWAKSAQNFLICLEMLLFSIAHFYTFPTDEWEDGYRASQENGKFGDTIALGDFFQDLKLILQTKKKKKKKTDDDSMTTVEEGDEDDDDATVSSINGGEYDEERATAIKDFVEAFQDADENTVERMDELAGRILEKSVSWEPLSPEKTASPGEVEEKKDTETHMGQYSGGAEVASITLDEDDELEVSERTSLLNAGTESVGEIRTENEEILRPSIFTMMSDVSRNNSAFK